MHAIERILAPLGRRVDEASPLCDARLPDGSRVNVVIPPLALGGPCLTIRQLPRATASRSTTWCSAARSPAAAGGVPRRRCVRARASVLVSGGTGSGKTTTLNALSGAIPDGERIVTIEDAAELRLRQRHVVRLEARPANVEGSGEVDDPAARGERAADAARPDRRRRGARRARRSTCCMALNTGHEGSLTTVHANSPADALRRVETLALMAGVGLPHAAMREQVASAIDLVVHQARGAGRRAAGGVRGRGGARGRRHGQPRAVPAARRAAVVAPARRGRVARAAGARGLNGAALLAFAGGCLGVAAAADLARAVARPRSARRAARPPTLLDVGAARSGREGRDAGRARAPAAARGRRGSRALLRLVRRGPARGRRARGPPARARSRACCAPHASATAGGGRRRRRDRARAWPTRSAAATPCAGRSPRRPRGLAGAPRPGAAPRRGASSRSARAPRRARGDARTRALARDRHDRGGGLLQRRSGGDLARLLRDCARALEDAGAAACARRARPRRRRASRADRRAAAARRARCSPSSRARATCAGSPARSSPRGSAGSRS